MSETATQSGKQNPMQFVSDALNDLRAKGVAPKLRVLQGEQKTHADFDGKEVINLASNNYLGLTTHKALKKAAIEAVRKYGAGAGAVRTIAGTITEFSTGITTGSAPFGITQGPDGNLWFTEQAEDRVARITPAGGVTEFSNGITPGAGPAGITTGPDGNLWFTESNGDRIGAITVAGVATEYAGTIAADPYGIASGPDSALWFTEQFVSDRAKVVLEHLHIPRRGGCSASL